MVTSYELRMSQQIRLWQIMDDTEPEYEEDDELYDEDTEDETLDY